MDLLLVLLCPLYSRCKTTASGRAAHSFISLPNTLLNPYHVRNRWYPAHRGIAVVPGAGDCVAYIVRTLAFILSVFLTRFRTTQYYVLTSTFGEYISPTFKIDSRLIIFPALVLYDYLLTLPLEIAEIWFGKLTGIKVLFLLNRYPYLLSQLMGLLYTFLYTTDAVRPLHTRFCSYLTGISLRRGEYQ